MRNLIFLLTVVFCNPLTSQTSNQNSQILGKWRICDIAEPKSSISQCSEEWSFEFLENGSYFINSVRFCNGRYYLESGEWKWIGEKIFLQPKQHCDTLINSPSEWVISWLTPDQFQCTETYDSTQFYFKRMISPAPSESQINTHDLFGKWKECITINNVNQVTIDSSFNCQSKWKYNFLNNGTYFENIKRTCEAKKQLLKGTWQLQGNKIILVPESDCNSNEIFPLIIDVYFLTQNKWFFVISETDQILVYYYYYKIE